MSQLLWIRPYQHQGWMFMTLFPLLLLVVAWVSQHQFDMQPCPWCVLQRLFFVGIAAVGLLGWAWPSKTVRSTAAAVAVVLSLFGTFAAIWQFLIAEQTEGCALTFADKVLMSLNLHTLWPDFFEPRASCSEAAVDLFGLPYALWALIAFQIIELLGLSLAFSARKPAA
jgi:disulfide bond formation protein DsbB